MYIDNSCYLDLKWDGTPINVSALQWFDTEGWIEFYDKSIENQSINELPDWANNAVNAWQAANDAANAPPPPPTAEENKMFASNLLYQTDWTTIPDVSNPETANPYLVNVSDFVEYRNQVRQIAINPVDGVINFPTKPDAVWANS